MKNLEPRYEVAFDVGLHVIPKGHYSENTMAVIIPKGHYSENNISVIFPKIT